MEKNNSNNAGAGTAQNPAPPEGGGGDKKSSLLPIVLIAVVVGLVGMMMLGIAKDDATDGDADTSEGRVIIGITDEAVELSSISELMLAIESASLEASSGAETALAATARDYELLDLKARSATEVYADADVAAGVYNAASIMLGDVEVRDSAGAHAAARLASAIRHESDIVVEAGETTLIVFDVIADEALHAAVAGEFVFAPVIDVQVHNDAEVSIDRNDEITLMSSNAGAKVRLGTDAEGNVGVNVTLPDNASFSVTGSQETGGEATIRIMSEDGLLETSGGSGAEGEGSAGGGSDGSPGGEAQSESDAEAQAQVTAEEAISAALNSGEIDQATTVRLVMRNGTLVWRVNGMQNLMLRSVYVHAETAAIVAVE